MSEAVTEQELEAKAVALRVTEKFFNDTILSVNYLNVGNAICLTDQEDHESHHLLTLCILVLKNGFTIVGKSACASPENYNKDIGERIALADAKDQMWPLLGYALKDHLMYGGQSAWAQPMDDGQPEAAPVTKPWLDGDARRNGR